MLEPFEQLLGKRRELLTAVDPRLSGKGHRAVTATIAQTSGTHESRYMVVRTATLAGWRACGGFRRVLKNGHVPPMVASLAKVETDVALADLVLIVGGFGAGPGNGAGRLSDRVLRAARPDAPFPTIGDEFASSSRRLPSNCSEYLEHPLLWARYRR